MDGNRRRNPRFECCGLAGVQVAPIEPALPGKVLDLSIEGCLILLHEPKLLTLCSMVELIFNVNSLPFRVRALVRANRSSRTVGFQFYQVSQRTCLQLEDLIDELRDSAVKRAKNKTLHSQELQNIIDEMAKSAVRYTKTRAVRTQKLQDIIDEMEKNAAKRTKAWTI